MLVKDAGQRCWSKMLVKDAGQRCWSMLLITFTGQRNCSEWSNRQWSKVKLLEELLKA
jgi:hypothetical protein